MHQVTGTDNFPAKYRADSLVSETDAQRGDRAAHGFQYLKADPGVERGPGARRKDHPVAPAFLQPLERCIAGHNNRITCQLANLLVQVESETVITVHNQNFHLHPPNCSIARTIAAALFSVSVHSFAGTESATIPAPTWI